MILATTLVIMLGLIVIVKIMPTSFTIHHKYETVQPEPTEVEVQEEADRKNEFDEMLQSIGDAINTVNGIAKEVK